MEQDPRLRPMSREENAAYRGVTVDESGAEPQDEEPQYSGAYSRSERSSVRYVRIGGGSPHRSLLMSLIWSALLAALLVLFFFVALPAIVMVLAGVVVLWAVVSIIGRGRIMSWVMRKLYGR